MFNFNEQQRAEEEKSKLEKQNGTQATKPISAKDRIAKQQKKQPTISFEDAKNGSFMQKAWSASGIEALNKDASALHQDAETYMTKLFNPATSQKATTDNYENRVKIMLNAISRERDYFQRNSRFFSQEQINLANQVLNDWEKKFSNLNFSELNDASQTSEAARSWLNSKNKDGQTRYEEYYTASTAKSRAAADHVLRLDRIDANFNNVVKSYSNKTATQARQDLNQAISDAKYYKYYLEKNKKHYSSEEFEEWNAYFDNAINQFESLLNGFVGNTNPLTGKSLPTLDMKSVQIPVESTDKNSFVQKGEASAFVRGGELGQMQAKRKAEREVPMVKNAPYKIAKEFLEKRDVENALPYIVNDADFEKYSKLPDVVPWDFLKRYEKDKKSLNTSDLDYKNYVNEKKSDLTEYEILWALMNGNGDVSRNPVDSNWVNDVPKEISDTFNYLYQNPKYGPKYAAMLAENIIEEYRNDAAQKAHNAFLQQEADLFDYPVLREGYQFLSGLESVPSGAIQWFDSDFEGGFLTDPEVAQALYDKNSDKWYKKFPMMFSQSLGNMLPAIAAETFAGHGAGKLVTFIGSGGNAVRQGVMAGMNGLQARLYGALVGGAEAGLQKLMGGIGQLGTSLTGKSITNLTRGIKSALTRTAIQFGGNIVSEIAEENIQNYLEPLFQMAVLHTDKYDAPTWQDFIDTTITTVLTTGFLDGMSLRSNYSINKYEIEVVEPFIKSTLETLSPEDPMYQAAEKMQDRLKNGDHVSPKDMIEMLNEAGIDIDVSKLSAKSTEEMRIEQVQAENPDAEVITSTSTQAYLNNGLDLKTAQNAGAVLDGIVSGEITAENISNNQIDKLNLLQPNMRSVVADTLGVEIEGVDSKSNARNVFKQTLRQYEQRIATESTSGQDVSMQQEMPTTIDVQNESASQAISEPSTSTERVGTKVRITPRVVTTPRTAAPAMTEQAPTQTVESSMVEPTAEQSFANAEPTAEQSFANAEPTAQRSMNMKDFLNEIVTFNKATPDNGSAIAMFDAYNTAKIEDASVMSPAEFAENYRQTNPKAKGKAILSAYNTYLNDMVGTDTAVSESDGKMSFAEFRKQYLKDNKKASPDEVEYYYNRYLNGTTDLDYLTFEEQYLKDHPKATMGEIALAYQNAIEGNAEVKSDKKIDGNDFGVIRNEYSDQIGKDIVDALDAVGKLFNVRIQFADLEAMGKDDNGLYNLSTRQDILLDINPQKAFITVAGHEIGHHLREHISKTAWNNFERYAVKVKGKDAISEKQNIPAYAEESVAREEVACDFIGEMIGDKGLLNDFCEAVKKQEVNKEAARGFINAWKWFKGKFTGTTKKGDIETPALVEKVKAAFGTDIETATEVVKALQTAYNEVTKSDALLKKKNTANDGGVKHSFKGYDAETGRGMYESNFPKGTPKSAKAAVILDYIKNVWSKKPINLVIRNLDGTTREIQARFDPTYDETGNTPTDASKLMGGNRHGTSAEQRVTLDLADDYYKIASESKYNYPKGETGKNTPTHIGVKQWHYFVNDIYFAEHGSDVYIPYRVTINVKEKQDGNYVYSFSAEKEEHSSQRTLHAVVNGGDFTAKGKLFDKMITNEGRSVNPSAAKNANKDVYKQDVKVKTDANGNTLSADQESFFENSAVRDDDGKLKVVYHGTNAEFIAPEIAEAIGRNGLAYQDSNGDIAVVAKPNKNGISDLIADTTAWKHSVKTYNEDVLTDENGNAISGRELTKKTLLQNGFSEIDAELVSKRMDSVMNMLQEEFADFAKLQKNLQKAVTTSLIDNQRVLYSLIKNGEYPVNGELSTTCVNRQAFQHIYEMLLDSGIMKDVVFNSAAIAEVNAILRDYGYLTSCFTCFVDARRSRTQAWAENMVSIWNEAAKAHGAKSAFGFHAKVKKANNTDGNASVIALEAAFNTIDSKSKNKQGNLNLGQGNLSTRINRLMDIVPAAAKLLTVEDIMSAEAVTEMRRSGQIGSNIFSLLKSSWGQASPKVVQKFEAYGGDIAKLTFDYIRDITGESISGSKSFVSQAAKEAAIKKLGSNYTDAQLRAEMAKQRKSQAVLATAVRNYLYTIDGLRYQSFSDSDITEIFDKMQFFNDMAANRFPAHEYTKVIADVRIFGMTNAKINGSVIHIIDASLGKENAGLVRLANGQLGYVADDRRNYEKTGKGKNNRAPQSIDNLDMIALMYDPRYAGKIGTVAIGFSHKHIEMMLDDPNIRMIIPYHRSALPSLYAHLTGLTQTVEGKTELVVEDFTDSQKTNIKTIKNANGAIVDRSDLSDAVKKLIEKKRASWTFAEKLLANDGNAKLTADEYKKWCATEHKITHGKEMYTVTFAPMFEDFAGHENYYKVLENYDTYNILTNDPAKLESVTMAYAGDSEATTLDAKQLAEYRGKLESLDLFTEEQIEKYMTWAQQDLFDIVREAMAEEEAYQSKAEANYEPAFNEVKDFLLKNYSRDTYDEKANADRIGYQGELEKSTKDINREHLLWDQDVVYKQDKKVPREDVKTEEQKNAERREKVINNLVKTSPAAKERAAKKAAETEALKQKEKTRSDAVKNYAEKYAEFEAAKESNAEKSVLKNLSEATRKARQNVINAYVTTDLESRMVQAKRDAEAAMHMVENKPTNQTTPFDSAEKTKAKHAEIMQRLNEKRAANRSGITLEEANEKYGTIDKGEKPVRDVSVPVSVDGETKVSKLARTAMESAITPEDAMPMFEEGITDGLFSYKPEKNAKQIEKAEARLARKHGVKDVFISFMGAAENGKLSKNDVADGILLYRKLCADAANESNATMKESLLQEATSVLAKLSALVREGAQITQMARMIKQLDPQRQLFALEQTVSDLQKQLDKKFKDDAPEIVIPEALKNRWLEALNNHDDVEIEMCRQLLYEGIAEQVPTQWADKFNAWRYLSMLGNPKTSIRNAFGNAGFVPVKGTKDKIGAAIEKVFLDKNKRTKYLGALNASKRGRELLKFADADFNTIEVQSTADQMGLSKYNDKNDSGRLADAIRDKSSKFKMPVLKQWQQFTDWAMNNELFGDIAFMKHHFKSSFAQAAMARGYSVEQLTDGSVSLDEIDFLRAYAIKQALMATYRDANMVSKVISKMRFKGDNAASAVGNLILSGALPFRGTPANIFVRAVEYSPLSLLKSVSRDIYKVKKGTMSGAEYIENLSRGLSGSAVFALGWFLASLGVLRTGADDDDEREGRQGYSLEIGDVSITLDWLAPESIPFFMGAETQKLFAGTSDAESFFEGIGDAFEPMLEFSMLSGINDMITTAFSVGSFGEAELDAAQIVTGIIFQPFFSYLGQYIPTIVSQTESWLSPERTQTYVGDISNSFARTFVKMAVKLSEKIPGFYVRQIPYVDNYGRKSDVKDSFGDYAISFANTFLNPAYVSKIDVTDTDSEIRRLEEVTGKNISPKRRGYTLTVYEYDKNGEKVSKEIRLSAEQFEKYQTEYGKQYLLMTTALIKSDAYVMMSDADQVKAFDEIEDLADVYGKMAAGVGYEPEVNDSNKPLYELYTKAGIPVAEAYALRLNKKQLSDDKSLTSNQRKLSLAEMINGADNWSDEQKQAAYVFAFEPGTPQIGDAAYTDEQKLEYENIYGRYVNDVYSNVMSSAKFDSADEATKADMLHQANELAKFYAKKEWATNNNLSSKDYDPETETNKYDSIMNAGATFEEAYAIVDGISNLKPIGDAKSVSGAQKWKFIQSVGTSVKITDAAMRAYLSDDQLEKYDQLYKSGVAPKTIIDIMLKNNELTNASGKKSISESQMKTWIFNNSTLTQEQKNLAVELYADFWTMNQVNSEKYDSLISEHGFDSSTAQKIFSEVSNLQPEKGKTDVSDKQKAFAIIGMSGLSNAQKYKALLNYANPDNVDDIKAAQKAGISATKYVNTRYAINDIKGEDRNKDGKTDTNTKKNNIAKYLREQYRAKSLTYDEACWFWMQKYPKSYKSGWLSSWT